MKRFMPVFFLLASLGVNAQEDSTLEQLGKATVLSEVVIRNDLNVVDFLKRVKEDTSFYKAFKNLRILQYQSLNDIRMMDKKGNIEASLYSKTRQSRTANCRTMQVLEEVAKGDIYDKKKNWNYYTAELYAGLFFTTGTVCNETNIVAGSERKVKSSSGIDRHKEQLKMLFFNPGKKIPGIPFIGDKIEIFHPDVAALYDYAIDMQEMNGQDCYLFFIKPKEGLSGSQKNRIVFDNITTWFNAKTFEIVARHYQLSYNTPAYDFNVLMEVEMDHYNGLLVPKLIRYNGNWKVVFKKRERGIFTATLYDFSAP